MSQRGCVIALLLVLALCVPVDAADERAREKNILTVKPGVVMVYSRIQVKVGIRTNEGLREFDPLDMSGSGSGFIVNPDGYIVTNGHVVKEYHSKENNALKSQALVQILEQHVFPALEQQKRAPLTQEEKVSVFQQLSSAAVFQVSKQLFVFLSNWQYLPAEIKQYSPPITPVAGKTEGIFSYEEAESGKDIAVLKIESGNLPTVPLGDSAAVSLQAAVFPAGYPGVVSQHDYLSQSSMLEASITSGHVSSLKLDVKGTPVIQFDAPVTWGNSGGPVFNERGEVIGIATFISLAPTGAQSAIPIQGFNFAVPINTAKEFISAAGIQSKRGLLDGLWQQALDFYFDEDYEAAVVKCDEILRLMPNQPDAKRIQVKSQEWLTAHPPTFFSRYGTILAVVGGALLLVVIVGAVVILAARGKKGAPAAPRPAAGVPEMKATVVDIQAQRQQVGSFGRVVCEKGPGAGKVTEIPSKGLVFGRDASQCTVVVPDDHVSKVHALLTPSPKGLLLEDRGSTNGTFINDVNSPRVQQNFVKSGDRIILGSKQAAIFRVE